MKNMAILDQNNIVINIIVVEDDEIQLENHIIYTNENPAYIGGDYFDNYFYAPQPYPSWTRDKGIWIPPIPYPDDNKNYDWNEKNQSWDLIDG